MKDLGKYYKSKYLALRAQYIKTIDFAFQEGYVKGQEDAQLQNMQQQVQEAQMAAQQAQAMGQMGGQSEQAGGQPPQEGQAPEGEMSPEAQGEAPPEGAMYGGGESPEEVDALINQLQQTIQKSEVAMPSLQKSLDRLTQIKNQKKSMGYANHLGSVGKLALSEQERLVEKLVKKWDNESSDAAGKIISALRSESIKG